MIKQIRIQCILLIMVILSGCGTDSNQPESFTLNFNKNWEFIIQEDTLVEFSDSSWTEVNLPHTPVIEPIIVNDQWQGICWYRKNFTLPSKYKNKLLFVKFEGAMNVAEVWINGVKKIKHYGGYLPFIIDITDEAVINGINELLIRLDNTDNPVTGPKPLEQLDFNMYGGLFRDVFLIVKDKLHITDPIFENKPASGGIFITYPEVSDKFARIRIQTHVRNDYQRSKSFTIQSELYFNNEPVIQHSSKNINLESFNELTNVNELTLDFPNLWSPQSPNLYYLLTKIITEHKISDIDTTRIGIKKFDISNERFTINGKETFLRGVNRHQEYPYTGYALSNEAQYRDAKKIKDAGFDYVRLSHYPHSPAFMDACDELGLVVLDAILGWQYFNEDLAFQDHVVQTCRDLIRRDRNHPCVMAWEVSLNESWMPEEFIDRLLETAHEEYPYDPCYTAGWQEYGYDIYLQARQHRLQHYQEPQKPYIVSEYGDWEYYALNAGLNQDTWNDLLQEERTSRQLLSYGEKRLLQQATNIQEAHNDNLNTPAYADGYWVMFDYNRGYADDLEASGIMSINRLPKFSYYFYQSQRDTDEVSDLYQSGPMVFIASFWDINSDLDVMVFSNCDEVELLLNDNLVERKPPDNNRISNNLAHPPFTFHLEKFIKGMLTAKGFINGKQVAQHIVKTQGIPFSLKLTVDECGRPARAGVNDVLFVYASVEDSIGTTIPENNRIIDFSILGNAELLSPASIKTEAGIAAVLIRIGDGYDDIKIAVKSSDLVSDSITLQVF